MKKTTDFNVIKNHPLKFVWGKIVKVHKAGPYDIVEYHPDSAPSETLFHVYVDEQSTNWSATSIEGALLLAIAKKRLDEVNTATHMAQAAMKLLDVTW